MLNGDEMKMAQKLIELAKKKTNLHMQHTFCISKLPFFWTTTTLVCTTKTSNFLVTHYF